MGGGRRRSNGTGTLSTEDLRLPSGGLAVNCDVDQVLEAVVLGGAQSVGVKGWLKRTDVDIVVDVDGAVAAVLVKSRDTERVASCINRGFTFFAEVINESAVHVRGV